MEEETFDLPDYDLRRLMNCRDPVSCVYAFRVTILCVVAPLLGLRMCPDCPHCCKSEKPCMDSFGSNGTPMGGSVGRADAMIGAIEAQKAEGVLHIHMFLFLQIVHQHRNLHDIAEMIKEKLISVEQFKALITHVRCASYPEVEKFNKERADIEQAWPAYANDKSLCQVPHFISAAPVDIPHLTAESNSEKWEAEGKSWRGQYEARLQHVMARMNHHIHPLVNASTDERRLLNSCRTKGKGETICKAGFPLEAEMSNVPFLVCPCVASVRGLPEKGRRSAIGVTFPARNEAYVNASLPAWSVFNGDNGDIKFPHRIPLLLETHEKVSLWDLTQCLEKYTTLELAYQTQMYQAAAAGYFGGYASKMQHIGQKEVKHLLQAINRKTEVEEKQPDGVAFKLYGKRLVKDLEGKGVIRSFALPLIPSLPPWKDERT